MSSYNSRESAMEVNGGIPSGATNWPGGRSRFSQLNNAASAENGSNGDVTITAGFLLPQGNGHLESESAFESRVISENSNKTVRIDIQRPTSGCSEGQNNLRSRNYGQSADQGRDVIGVVTIGKASDDNKKQQNGVGGCHQNKFKGCPKDPPRPQTFQIYVKNHDGKSNAYDVGKTTTVDKLMSLIQEKLGIPPEQQVLNFAGRNLQRGMTLEHYGVESGSTIFLTLRLRGGGAITTWKGQQWGDAFTSFSPERSRIPPGQHPYGFGSYHTPKPQSFQMFVKNHNGKTSTYNVDRTTMVEELKSVSQERPRIPPGQDYLDFAGSKISGGWTLD